VNRLLAVQIINAILVLILVVVTAFYAWRTHAMAKEMQEARKAQMLPHIEAKLAILRDRDPLQYILIISNVGPGPAKNPSIKFWTEPSGGSDREWKPLLLFSGERWDLKIPVGPNVDDIEMEASKLVANYKCLQIRGTYEDIFGKTYQISKTIDFQDYIGGLQFVRPLIPEDEIHNIRTELEKIQKSFTEFLKNQ
jgi:hypothetical protein